MRDFFKPFSLSKPTEVFTFTNAMVVLAVAWAVIWMFTPTLYAATNFFFAIVSVFIVSDKLSYLPKYARVAYSIQLSVYAYWLIYAFRPQLIVFVGWFVIFSALAFYIYTGIERRKGCQVELADVADSSTNKFDE